MSARSNRKNRIFHLYEQSVQSPRVAVDWYANLYRELRGGYARRLREDFGGTFAMSCEWVRRNRRNTATVVELDPVPLEYGKRFNLKRLNGEQRKRVGVLLDNVLTVRSPKADLIVAGNFSFYVFQTRKTLVQYLSHCRRSLEAEGIVCLEMAGGPGMIETTKERKLVQRGPKAKPFTYIWDQKSFDPITHRARYGIHFKIPGVGRESAEEIRDAFTYDWRIWTIPEVREALADAGFKSTAVFWETEHKGEGTGEFVRSEVGDNAFSWIAYVVGLR